MFYFKESCILTSLVSLIFGIVVYARGRGGKINKVWLLMSISVSLWSLGLGLMISAISEKTALFYLKYVHYVGAIFIPAIYLHFTLILIGKDIEKKKLINVSYVVAVGFIISNFAGLFATVKVKPPFNYYTDPRIFYPLYTLLFITAVGYSLFLMFKTYRDTTGLRRQQIKYQAFATVVGFGGGSSAFFYVFNIPILPIGMYFMVSYNLIMSYAIIRYRLMDIRVAITRFGIFVSVYSLVLGIPFWIGYKYHLWHYSTLLMAVLATLGPFIYLILEKRSKALLYKTEFKRYETLRRFSKTLLLIKELEKLLELIVYRLVKTLRVTYAGIYLYEKEKDAYILKSYRPLKYPNMPNGETLTTENLLIKLLFVWRRELIREEVVNLPLTKKVGSNSAIDLGLVQYEMQKLSATLVIPHFVENDLLGFLVLGDKEKGAIYTEEDISILSALSNSAALAIENALFLIDLKITQAELFNAKRIAELGYMASAMGHEINNRLQAIYSAGLDMIDNPVIYDVVKNNPQAKESFDNDIKHINENIEDATAIINELKTYARPQDKTKQNFEPLNLSDVMDKALKVVRLQSTKAFDMIGVDINMPKALPKIFGNFIQLQQVFVNLLNNAHDAILEKKNYASAYPEANIVDYKGKIQIKVEEVKNLLDIHVLDNGIGMTEEIKKRLFIPLYTSKASSERKAERGMKGGTGIGLYTIQTIIRGHNGAISVYDTQWLKGTDFLITLPIAKEKK